jgi:membrane protease subunit HflC
MRTLIPTIAVLVLAILVVTGTVVVDETEHVVITQFGRPVAVHSEAGIYLKLPAPLQRVTRFDKRILFTLGKETELLTADKKNVLVASYLSWRIAEPLKYLTALRTREFAEARLQALVQSELGSVLGDLPFDELVPAKGEGEGLDQLKERVHDASAEVAASDFGIEIVSLGITRLSFPAQNLQSVFARMRAERERIARGYRSEGKAEAQKIRAEADRQRDEILATAEAEAERLRGQGEAEAARIYAEAYGGYEDFYAFLRTLESYERVLNGNTTLVLPADSPFLELLMSRRPGAVGRGR